MVYFGNKASAFRHSGTERDTSSGAGPTCAVVALTCRRLLWNSSWREARLVRAGKSRRSSGNLTGLEFSAGSNGAFGAMRQAEAWDRQDMSLPRQLPQRISCGEEPSVSCPPGVARSASRTSEGTALGSGCRGLWWQGSKRLSCIEHSE